MRAPGLAQRHSRLTREWITCGCEELLYRLVIVPLVAFLLAALAYGVACLRGEWRYRLDTAKRQQIISNLQGVFGDQGKNSMTHTLAIPFCMEKLAYAAEKGFAR